MRIDGELIDEAKVMVLAGAGAYLQRHGRYPTDDDKDEDDTASEAWWTTW